MSIPVNKTLEEIRTDLFEKISSVQQDGWLPEFLNLNRGPVRGMIELWAWGLYQLYQLLALVLRQAFPSTATGDWLDLHCKQVGVERLAATKAKGTVWFTREGTSGNVSIPKGKIIKTKPDGEGIVYRFSTTEDAVLPDGSSEVAVSVEAEEYGRKSNVSSGMITEISTVIPGIDSVENRSGWLTSEGFDREGDDSLRERYFLAWLDVNGATKYAYESWARSIEGVIAVKILDQHPRGQGTVDVIIRGSAGIPTQELLDAVDEVVQTNRPINDDVMAKGPAPVNVTIEAELQLVSGDPDEIMSEAENRLTALFTKPPAIDDIAPLSMGTDLTIDRLTAVVMAINGIKKITWTLPATDVQVNDDALAVLSSITLTYSWASEE
ncbi:MAG: baseplate J/gp47 family protein [Deltaproteobacteria bacterium]|nr:baseplate J/gp47 family protein [Deltaproteobacteria bacterium]